MKSNIIKLCTVSMLSCAIFGCGSGTDSASQATAATTQISKTLAETGIVQSTALTPPVVQTTSGSFQGNFADAYGVMSFKGMPYAKPPVGPLRWRAPQPVSAAPDIRQALDFGNACISAPGPYPDPPNVNRTQSEDCLTLNIWTPRLTGGAPKPVMVWIHGGGFQYGTSATPTYDGALLASHDAVIVSINYRLGVFGFLATDQLDSESGTSGAWGLLDQIAALKWIQQNIKQFGGDPKNVTVFGESAGAHSVGMLMTSARAQGLFSKAIMESGATWDTEHGSIATHQEALVRGQDFSAKFLNQDLREIPAELIRAAEPWDDLTDPTITAFGPSIDGDVLTDSPMNVFHKKMQADIPVLGGWNGAEWFPFVGRVIPAVPPAVFYTAASNLFGQNCIDQFKLLYPQTNEASAQDASFQLTGDLGIAEQTWEVLKHQAQKTKAYAYRFVYTSAYSPTPIHTSEVPFVFGTLTRQALGPTATPSFEDKRMSEMMMTYWTNFARTGNPNGAGLPVWPEMGAAGTNVLRLDNITSEESNPEISRFQFIEKYRQAGRLPSEWRSLGSPYVIQYRGPACP